MRQKILFVCFLTLACLLIATSLCSATIFDWITGKLTTQNTAVTITISGNPPIVETMTAIPSQIVTEAGITNVTFYMNVTEQDGISRISTVNASFNMTGQTTRTNTTCVNVTSYNSTKGNYSCTVGIYYWDQGGNWNDTVMVKDIDNNVASNTSSFVLGSTSAFVLSPATLTWASAAPGATNKTPSNTPVLLNNTANTNITAGNIQVKAYDLLGATNSAYSIQSGNFTAAQFGGAAAECNSTATSMVNASYATIPGATLGSGNNTASQGESNIYYCLKTVPASIISQAYYANSTGYGSWVIKIA